MTLYPQAHSNQATDKGLYRLLGILRIMTACLLLYSLTMPNAMVAPLTQPDSFWSPMSIAWYFDTPPPIAFVQWTIILAIMNTILLGLGCFTRWTGPLAFVFSWMALSLSFSFGKLNHTSNTLMMLLFIFSFSAWGHCYSLDRLLQKWRHHTPQPPVFQNPEWPFQVWYFSLSLFYFSSGFLKLVKGNFLVEGYVSGVIKAKELVWTLYGAVPAPLQALNHFLIAHTEVTNLIAIGTALLELFFFVGLFSRRLRVFMLSGALFMHAFIALTTKVFFAEHLIVLVLMLLSTVVLSWKDARPEKRFVPLAQGESEMEEIEQAGQSQAWEKTLCAYALGLLLLWGLSKLSLPMVPLTRWLNWSEIHTLFAFFLPDPQVYGLNNRDLVYSLVFILLGGGFLVFSGQGILQAFVQVLRNPVPPPPDTERWLLYDADCGFCQQWVNWALHRHVEPLVRFKPCQFAEELRNAGRIQLEECAQYAVFLELKNGRPVRVEKGAGAINAVLEQLPGPHNGIFRLVASLYHLDIIREVEHLVYRWIAHHRHQLSRGHCSIHLST